MISFLFAVGALSAMLAAIHFRVAGDEVCAALYFATFCICFLGTLYSA